MRSVGVRELKAKTSEVLRQVSEQGETDEVTVRGHVIARLAPVEPVNGPQTDRAFWEEWDRLAAEISAHWPEGVSAVDAVREQRREL